MRYNNKLINIIIKIKISNNNNNKIKFNNQILKKLIIYNYIIIEKKENLKNYFNYRLKKIT